MSVFDGKRALGARQEDSRSFAALDLRLLNTRLAFRDFAEFRQAIRHRYMLAAYFAASIPAIVLLYALDNSRLPIDLQVPTVVVGLVAAQIVLLIYLRLAIWVMRTAHPDAPVLTIWVTPGLTLGAAVMLATAHVAHKLMSTGGDWVELQSHLLPFICVLYMEVAATLLFRGPMRRALGKLREGQPFTLALVDLASPPDAPSIPPQAPVMAEETGALLRQSAALGIELGDILRLEASGNYVTLVTRKGRHLVPGPFSAAVAQMPKHLGLQVQRSHWVARAAVEGFHRRGRDLWLQVACGASVPVSAAQKVAVQAWLQGQGRQVPVMRRGGTRSSERAIGAGKVSAVRRKAEQ
jgi:DNA-binding LytR/AlgR family response regulator